MNIQKLIIYFGILSISLLSFTVNAEEWPHMIEPPSSSVVWVGDNVIQNGVAMRMKKFESELSVEDIINFYRAQWQGLAEYAPVENEMKDWSIIGIRLGDYYLTVQAKTGDELESEGFIGVSKLPVMTSTDLNVDFPILDGSEIISNTDSIDIGSSANTIILKNTYSVQSNVSFYQAEMSRDGWALMREAEQPGDWSGTKFMYFQKSKKSCLLTISNNDFGDTVVVVNKIKH